MGHHGRNVFLCCFIQPRLALELANARGKSKVCPGIVEPCNVRQGVVSRRGLKPRYTKTPLLSMLWVCLEACREKMSLAEAVLP